MKLKYASEPYTEISEQYSKTQPVDQRKLGFGSHDATKSGEFTCNKATERFRSAVKQENKLRESHRNTSSEKEILSKKEPLPLPPKDKDGNILVSQIQYYLLGLILLSHKFAVSGGSKVHF